MKNNFYENKTINDLANEVVKYLPSLSDYYALEENLTQYSKRINQYQPHPTYLKRQDFFRKKLKQKIEQIFNKEEQENIKFDIKDDWGVLGGIVEHHGLIDHPLLLSVALVSNFYKLTDRDQYGDILTFATGNVPLNEPFRKRGVMLNEKKINLFPKKMKNQVVYGLKTYEFNLMERIRQAKQMNNFSTKEIEFIEMIDKIINDIDFSTCRYLGDQYTKINYYLWTLLFEKNIRGNAANLISIEYDSVVIDYLIHILENDSDSFVYQMLFDKKFRDVILQEFEQVPGAWDEKRGVGSHFFWALDDKNERVHLKLEDGYLVGINREFKIKYDLKELVQAMKDKKLLPGMLLKFSLILFYMGMKPLAGYSLEYLVRMKERMLKILSEYFPQDAEIAKTVPLDNMNLISICKEKDKNKIKDLHGFDIMYRGGFSKKYLRNLNSIPFKEYMIPFLPFAYEYGLSKYGNPQEKKNFNISEEDLQKSLNKIFN